MLYARRVFKLTLLVSKGSCYVIAAVCSLLIFSNVVFPLRRFVVDKFPKFANFDILIVSAVFLVATVCIYQALKHLLDKIFIREELIRSETLKEFSAAVSRSLNINEILDVMVQVIQNTIGVKKVYVCLIHNNGERYQVSYNTNALDKRSYYLKKDNPRIIFLQVIAALIQRVGVIANLIPLAVVMNQAYIYFFDANGILNNLHHHI